MEKTELKVRTSLYNMKIISETKKNMEDSTKQKPISPLAHVR
mgnify:CR=1 FL=1